MDNKDIYRIEKVNEHLYRILGITEEYAYLVIGGKKALLIDTCCGIGNIREIVDSLTSLPYDVILTHGHVDHAGGVGLFKDKKIYLNKLDWKMAKNHMKKFMRKFYISSNFRLTGNKTSISDICFVNNKNVVFNELNDGQVFDLGDLHIKAISLAGHTKGMTTLLIIEDRLLITGDACNPSVFLFLPGSLTVKEYRDNLIPYIEEIKDKYDKILLSHLPKESNSLFPNEMLNLCNQLLEGKKNEYSFKVFLMKTKVAKKFDSSTGFTSDYGPNIFYKKLK